MNDQRADEGADHPPAESEPSAGNRTRDVSRAAHNGRGIPLRKPK
jgi:hypothetical protein